MSHSTGFFISAKTHEVKRIHEHATAVVEDPESFGLEPFAIKGLQPRKDRFEILSRVMKVGWIRIRRRRSDMSVEFSCSWIEAILAVAVNAELIGFGPMTFLICRHIETGESRHTYACDVVEALEEKKIAEFLKSRSREGEKK